LISEAKDCRFIRKGREFEGKDVKRIHLRTYLIFVFYLPAIVCFAQAQGQEEQGGLPEVDSNQIEVRRQSRRLSLRKLAAMKKWGQLTPGMSQDQVKKILGRPRLAQGGSDECIWFYQELPESNAGRDPRVGPAAFGGARAGVAFFETKSVDSLIEEERIKLDEAISDAQAARDKTAERAHEKCDDAIAEETARAERTIAEREREDEQETLEYYEKASRRWTWRGRYRARARFNQALIENKINNAATIEHRDRAIARHRSRRDSLIKLAEARYESNVRKAQGSYEMRVKRLREGQRSPVFELKFFNPPDWEHYEGGPTNRRRVRIDRAAEKWQKPLNWRRLKVNMPADRVYEILGQPHRSEMRTPKIQEYYGDVAGHGEVHFGSSPDVKKCLDSWTEPFWPAVEESVLAESQSEAQSENG
jgi:outer membrane protein assembly factor BamE (lipoprotein component of BamABCDE complex)